MSRVNIKFFLKLITCVYLRKLSTDYILRYSSCSEKILFEYFIIVVLYGLAKVFEKTEVLVKIVSAREEAKQSGL